MCWSKNVSITMFLLGTAFNALVWKQIGNVDQIKVLILTSQFILLMQLFDAIVWSNQPCSNRNKNMINRRTNALQMIFNLLQPIVFFVLSVAYLKIKPKEKNFAIGLISFYAFYTIFSLFKNVKIRCSEPVQKHLSYYWWDDMKKYASGSIFFVILILLFLTLVQDKNYAFILAGYGCLAMIISFFRYAKYGTGVIGHMWCFYQVLLPIIIYVGYKISLKLKESEERKRKKKKNKKNLVH